MRRITLLLMLIAIALLAVSGVAWAVTKTCPPHPQVCRGTSGDDVLKSTSKDNNMEGLAGNDTYTNFVKPNPGFDIINDAAGTDKLVLTNYTQAEAIAFFWDTNGNGRIDSLYIDLPPEDPPNATKNAVGVVDFFDDTKTDCPSVQQCPRGPGYIETIQLGGGAGTTVLIKQR
jgi:hypothetical protein